MNKVICCLFVLRKMNEKQSRNNIIKIIGKNEI